MDFQKPGFTKDQVEDAGWMIDSEGGDSYSAHRWTGDVKNLKRETAQFMEVSASDQQEDSWYDWNGALMRYLVPDKLSISIGGDATFFLGVGAQPINFSILTRGKEPGVYLTPSFNANAGIGAVYSGGVNFGTSVYTGNPRDITASMLLGPSHGGTITAAWLWKLLSVGLILRLVTETVL